VSFVSVVCCQVSATGLITRRENTYRVVCLNEYDCDNEGSPAHWGPLRHDKGKAIPLQAWSGPEGSKKLRFSDYMTTAKDGGKVVSLTHRPPLPPGNVPGTNFC
jgi:hypothetical protein